jgi:phosphohistidine phosphatase SixA
MAGMKGTELVELLKTHNPSIQTILISDWIRAKASAESGMFFG